MAAARKPKPKASKDWLELKLAENRLRRRRELGLSDAEYSAYFDADRKKPGRGRPAKEIALEEIEHLCRLGSTDEELAHALRVNVKTIQRWKKQKAFAEAMQRGQAAVKISLRRAQIRMALSDQRGAATMLVWLGKQLLGQKDRIAQEHSGPNGAPIELADARSRLADLLAKRAQATGPDSGPREAE